MGPRAQNSKVFQAGDAVGDGWSWLLLREAIVHDVTRFGEFQRRLGLPRQTLAARLTRLVESGLFLPAQRSYELSPAGRDFFTCILSADEFGRRWAPAPQRWDRSVHRACGQPLTPLWVCKSCGLPLDPRAVTAQPLHRADDSDTVRVRLARQRTPRLDHLDRVTSSPTIVALKILGDRWSSMIIEEAFLGTRRFEGFVSHLGIAPNILTQRLSRLSDLGILERIVYNQSPRRHEYHLTAMGLDLYPIPISLLEWGRRWLPETPATIAMIHRPCGQALHATLTCEVCGLELATGSVDFTD